MRSFVRSAAVLAAASAICASVVTSAQAEAVPAQKPAARVSTNPNAGDLYLAVNGLPKTVKLGETVNVVYWYMQTSQDTLVPAEADLELSGYEASLCLKGMSLQILDPSTGKWEKSGQPDCGDAGFLLPYWSKPISVRPHYWAHLDMKITFGAGTHLGAWHLSPFMGGFQLWKRPGVYDPRDLQIIAPNYAFQVER
ncbi:hypothetical protein [Streptacidiphilus sp. MAP5-3]|uniref:hypothetical protein n=1 Tax=unclassified Streptacidiphilus TaxID=2643834 RepID=UPI0035169D3F